MAKPYVVYGQKGTGSVPVEATLLLLGEPYELLQPAPSEKPAAGDLSEAEMARVNPMQQVPALILPNGELMTESAAILIHLADSHPLARLAPAPDDPGRPAFLRWMGMVPDDPAAVTVIERLLSRQLGPQGRELVAVASSIPGATTPAPG